MHPMLRVALECIRKASRKIINQYDRIDKHVDAQSVDKLAQRILIDELSDKYSYLHFIAEEEGMHEIPSSGAEWLCIIDPLDGSNNFYHKIPLFAMSVAFARFNTRTNTYELETAMIYDPLNDNLFYAEKGHGAFMNQRRMRIAHSNYQSKDSILSSVLLMDVTDDLMKRLIDITSNTIHTRKLGCISLACAMSANSQAQGCIIDRANIWDIAAGVLIVQESGGVIMSLEEESFHWMNPNAFITGQAGFCGWLKHQLSQ